LSIIEDVEIGLEAGVLDLAVPSISASVWPQAAGVLRRRAVLAVALADGTQRVISVSLTPPTDNTTRAFLKEVRTSQIMLPGPGSICRAIAMKATTHIESAAADVTDWHLIVAAASDSLSVSRISFSGQALGLDSSSLATRTIGLPYRATHLSFTPSMRAAQLLLVNTTGEVHLLDPMDGLDADQVHSSSSESALRLPPTTNDTGRWLMTFHTPLVQGRPGRARRKCILSAEYVLTGKAILVLLEDGEWGIWDVAGPSQPGRSAEDFVLRGFLGLSSAAESAEPSDPKRGGSKLAPMTPNTRKAKAENLFAGTPKVAGMTAKGGISVTQNSFRTGQTDESVVMWYGSDVYTIPSLQAFWQRSTAGSGGGFGSLYSPGLTHITDINLMNEAITSISQFGSKSSSNSLGQMNTQRDLLVSAEHRFIILQSTRPPTPAKALFQQAVAERPTSRDQRMLDAGDLDIGGMDRMLDSMANDDARPRRVGFAH